MRWGRRRVRPRFFVLLAAGVAALVWWLSRGPGPAASRPLSPAAVSHTARPTVKTVRYSLPPFGLPTPLTGFSVETQGGVTTLAGGSTGSQLSDAIYTFMPTGIVTAGQLAAPRVNGALLPVAGQLIYAGGQNRQGLLEAGSERIGAGGPSPFRLPVALADYAVAASGTQIYLVGGATAAGPSRTIYAMSRDGLAARAIATLPVGLTHPAAAYFNGRLWILGGRTANGGFSRAIYQLEGNRVVPVMVLPTGLADAGVAVWHGAIWMVGGRGSGGAPTRSVFIIQPGRVEQATPLPQALADCQLIPEANGLWILGGQSAGHVSSAIYRLTVSW